LVSRRVARLQAKGKAESQQHAAIASKAAGYIRVSTDEQATHGHGLEVQEKAIRAFADSQGLRARGADRGSRSVRRNTTCRA
jgi:site-specific DNA recombinase